MPAPTIERGAKPTAKGSGAAGTAEPRTDRPRAQRMSIRRALTRPVRHLLLAAIVVVIGGLVGVLPFATRSLQDETYAQSRERLSQLERENAALTSQRDLLKTDEEVARLAREEFGLAPTDATVYAIPGLRPDNEDRDRTGGAVIAETPPEAPKRGLGDRVVDFIVFWD
jgi:cell division protein FtsB